MAKRRSRKQTRLDTAAIEFGRALGKALNRIQGVGRSAKGAKKGTVASAGSRKRATARKKSRRRSA